MRPTSSRFTGNSTQIIEKERPGRGAANDGGQTALNCALELERQGVWKGSA
ncbi:carbamoyl-phosphate synthase large subunit [Escherichia coli]|uniref:Carbamoyl-phosphate synthase large subunit n=1 Tax=Escherichia coli TaxID=562 RepID=A0A376RPJ3_ECOLX|nr:carbamoyl-phosphate synthase large subunit [Escherichia coli]